MKGNGMQTIETQNFSFRVRTDLLEALSEAAEASDMTLSGYIRKVLSEHVGHKDWCKVNVPGEGQPKDELGRFRSPE